MLTPWAPFPLDAGSRRVWTACKLLKDRYRFSLLTFLPSGQSYSGLEGVDDEQARRMASHLKSEREYLTGVFDSIHWVTREDEPAAADGFHMPEDVQRHYSAVMLQKLAEVIVHDKVDMVHIEFDLMAPYARAVKSAFPRLPCLLTQHDMGTISLFRSYFREMDGWRRFLRLHHWWRRVLFTRQACAQFDGLVVLTAADRRRLSWLMASSRRIHEVPTGVDLEHFREAPPRQQREPDSLVYVGHYPHYPNEDAVLWFAREILPRIWAQRPSVKFYVVGSYPTDSIRRLAARDKRIVVTGLVPDVKPYEARAMVMVAPLRLGKGIKGKILEGFAVGTPVVATSCANEGIRAVAGRDILLADSPRGFAAQTLRLLGDAQLWERLSGAGRAFVAGHAWSKRAGQLDSVYQRVLADALLAS